MEINNSIERDFGVILPYDSVKIATMFERNGVGRTGLYEGRVIGCAGVHIPWPKFGIAWAVLAKEARNHPFFIHRNILHSLREYTQTHGLERIEANVNADVPILTEWVKRLGFKYESEMPKWMNGQTFHKYVILP